MLRTTLAAAVAGLEAAIAEDDEPADTVDLRLAQSVWLRARNQAAIMSANENPAASRKRILAPCASEDRRRNDAPKRSGTMATAAAISNSDTVASVATRKTPPATGDRGRLT